MKFRKILSLAMAAIMATSAATIAANAIKIRKQKKEENI